MADVCDGQWTMESFRAHPGLGLQEDITKKGRVLPMENGQWKGGSAGEPGRLSHFITDYCVAGGMGNGEWRKISASCAPGQGSSGNDQLGAANAPSSAMEWTMAPGKMESKL